MERLIYIAKCVQFRLSVAGEQSGKKITAEFDPVDLLLNVRRGANRDSLTLVRTEQSGGTCGGPSLILQ